MNTSRRYDPLSLRSTDQVGRSWPFSSRSLYAVGTDAIPALTPRRGRLKRSRAIRSFSSDEFG